ncbi:MAG: hypothetical protein IPL26_07155 [Leptospiraceae bacterium]|nr:hypothetical protein [Leptospiraceae bacterium]
MDLIDLITELTLKLIPPVNEIKADIADLKKAHPYMSKVDLANEYADIICWKYTSVGVISALPSVIPGLGTTAQVMTEVGSIGTDLALMIRWMGSICLGVGLIFERDIENNFNREFIAVLGKWCGVIDLAKNSTGYVATKIANAQFKKLPADLLIKINQRVGTTILTKYGTKRGGIAVGKLIPFGIGAVIGGSFNLATMKYFKKKAIEHFQTDDKEEFIVN